jgi:hypothetical protein
MVDGGADISREDDMTAEPRKLDDDTEPTMTPNSCGPWSGPT